MAETGPARFWNVSEGTTVLPPTNSTAEGPDIAKTYKITLTVLFSTVIVFGVALNSLVIYTVYRWPELRTPCNLLIMNIAIGDLAIASVAAPMRIAEVFIRWPFGDFLCRVLVPLQEMFVTVSVLSHTTIALERFRAIVKPLKRKMSLRGAKFAVLAIWPVCYVTSSLPLAVAMRGIQDRRGVDRCVVMWPFELYQPIYQIYLVSLFIAVPLFIQTMAYFKIMKTLQTRLMPVPSPALNSNKFTRNPNSSSSMRYMKRKRLIRTLAILVFAFQVCYIPRGVMMLIVEFSPRNSIDWSSFMYADLVTLILFYLKHVMNPIILFATSSDFRRLPFLQVLCR